MKTVYCLQVDHTHHTAMMVCLNGIPVYDRAVGNETISTTSAPDQWLVPGQNTMSLTMKRGEVGPTTAIAVFMRDMRTNTKLASIQWPADFATPTDPAPLGTRVASFDVDATHERPVFMDAPRTIIPPEGNEMAYAPLEAMVRAFQSADPDGVYEAIRLKTEEHHRFHGVQASAPETVRRLVAERVKEPYWMQPLDRDQLFFEPCADGRLHRVTRRDGNPVIYGYPATAKAPAYKINPFLILMGDGYRILF